MLYPKQKQPGCKKLQNQSEARLQVTKTFDIKEGQGDKTSYSEMIHILHNYVYD